MTDSFILTFHVFPAFSFFLPAHVLYITGSFILTFHVFPALSFFLPVHVLGIIYDR